MTPGPHPDTSRHIRIYGGRGMGEGDMEGPHPKEKGPPRFILLYMGPYPTQPYIYAIYKP